MVLASIQQRLQLIYDLDLGLQVDDFVITDAGLAETLGAACSRVATPEKLLVSQSGEDLEVSLYLAEELLQAITENDPFKKLDASNLVEFCTAIEGVSHFVYLAWNASHGRTISQLELELQSEVDKFVSLLSLLQEQGYTFALEEIAHWLFEACSFDAELRGEALYRYQRANHYAQKFCAALHQQGEPGAQRDFDYPTLRRFYRKRHHDKLRQCDTAPLIRGP